MGKTKIDWADYTWNPVTGCYHGCPYCYANIMAKRFGKLVAEDFAVASKVYYNRQPLYIMREKPRNPYPFGFSPTIHLYPEKEEELAKINKPSTVFVGSMADVFGKWIPDGVITEIFDICKRYPHHTYLFLTKNPERYLDLYERGLLPDNKNFWYGTTINNPRDAFFFSQGHNTFLSIEPIMEDFNLEMPTLSGIDWVIIGAETGNRKEKIVPKQEWIDYLLTVCKDNGVPVFLKKSLETYVSELSEHQNFPF